MKALAFLGIAGALTGALSGGSIGIVFGNLGALAMSGAILMATVNIQAAR